jgi:hypothetical protein
VDRYGNPASNTETHRESEQLMGIAGMLDDSQVGPASLASSLGAIRRRRQVSQAQLLKYETAQPHDPCFVKTTYKSALRLLPGKEAVCLAIGVPLMSALSVPRQGGLVSAPCGLRRSKSNLFAPAKEGTRGRQTDYRRTRHGN